MDVAGDGQEGEALELGIGAAAGDGVRSKALMFDWTITLAKAMIEFCTPEGRP